MLATLRQCMDGERGHLRPCVPSANNDVASDAEDLHTKVVRIESDVSRINKELSSLLHVRETGQKIVRVESDVNEMKKELAGLSSVRVTLAELQAQLQMLLNTCVIPGQLPPQLYHPAQMSPYH
ncbi:hypothetical protein ISF_09949 [Cordyceps fumosorosea ARSEF 2679]|uniref:Uncharacterized protein n=1 Tax=Cordyceps fumosorosea (strain ARSEF 2679) TaxID=1081104 RepID=A0A166Y0Q8_CORFA|nr:hypothetical protein ISF_09949 [Cordyceps fumosorosea ARSEF 2679]OAA36403.1 hypothetical protein ISF_09949 [Cordyceps fumosorosea ARSEF 2679]